METMFLKYYEGEAIDYVEEKSQIFEDGLFGEYEELEKEGAIKELVDCFEELTYIGKFDTIEEVKGSIDKEEFTENADFEFEDCNNNYYVAYDNQSDTVIVTEYSEALDWFFKEHSETLRLYNLVKEDIFNIENSEDLKEFLSRFYNISYDSTFEEEAIEECIRRACPEKWNEDDGVIGETCDGRKMNVFDVNMSEIKETFENIIGLSANVVDLYSINYYL